MNTYKYSNFPVYINNLKNTQIAKRFNAQIYIRLDLKDIDFGIANVDLCFDSEDSAIKWFEKIIENMKKFKETK